ncbi:hypothetical protein UFOVP1349_31 [uncultured Caudovirales phage]|uniref:Uncharacterized protein n=1 Tax=uncultured Caudovirales phage TaxID=2100421 RepID=A0A6J5PIE2_9CAUD|nr:hypothetical protein UFOVP925_12 [uncultured Caudovirales phage]CAB4184225.1 hypothetical protein UFOVP1097_37 [uncultured Caudovirales phage]CAB4200162.1 hypothetical protein UFOVP1349_31 [uncultured Caudovirales phage]CAB4214035.1 hypothetical protein UFOVP1456_11 [uncultured Caudovirales phage]
MTSTSLRQYWEGVPKYPALFFGDDVVRAVNDQRKTFLRQVNFYVPAAVDQVVQFGVRHVRVFAYLFIFGG